MRHSVVVAGLPLAAPFPRLVALRLSEPIVLLAVVRGRAPRHHHLYRRHAIVVLLLARGDSARVGSSASRVFLSVRL